MFREISFIKPQNETETTDKRLKPMKNQGIKIVLFWLSFCNLFSAWKIVDVNFPTIFQAPNKLQKPNQNKIGLFPSFFIIFNRLSVV